MIHPINHLHQAIRVGIQTEQGVESIGFDLSPWLTRWPEMTFAVWATRPGENAAYPVANTEMVGNVLYWYPNATDTEKEGAGTVEIVGVSEGKTKSSGPVDTLVKKTTLDVTQETPEPIVPWFQELQKTAGVAQQGAAEAAASAQSAAQSAETADQSSANADTKAQEAHASAQEAKQSEDNAAAHAESASKSEQTAIANADDAESFAKNAQAAAAGASASAESAGVSAQSASNSAEAASASAKEAENVVQDIKDDMQGNDGKGGLYLVSVNHNVSPVKVNREYSDIAAAIDAGDTCLLVDTREVFPCIGYKTHPDTGERCIAFRGEIKTSTQYGMASMILYVNQDGTVYESGSYVKIPSPQPLTVRKGETSTRYDGSSAVAVDMPDVLVVTCDMSLKSSHTNGEVKSAASAGTAVFMVYNGNPFNLIGWTDGLAKFERLYRAPLPGEAMTAIRYMQATLQSDKTFDLSGDIPATTPNPMPLEFTGAVTATYDGTVPVQVEIPQGGGGSGGGVDEEAVNKLVEEKLNAMLNPVVILSETTTQGSDGEMYILTPPSNTPEVGKTYSVTYNGTPYDCPALEYETGDGMPTVVMGNTDLMGVAGGNSAAPFIVTLLLEGTDMGDGVMLYGMVMDLAGASSATLSIASTGGMDIPSEKYIVNVTVDNLNYSSASTVSAIDKTAAEIGAAVKAGKQCTVIATDGYEKRHLPLVVDRYTTATVPAGTANYFIFSSTIQNISDSRTGTVTFILYANDTTKVKVSETNVTLSN